jgi:DNA-binding transcriptional ArsR family regulator
MAGVRTQAGIGRAIRAGGACGGSVHRGMTIHMQVNTPSVVPIDRLETLQVLVDSQRHRIVTLLMDEPLSARDLAERLGIGRTRLYYHLGLLERHGLIRVCETRIVSGIEERRYLAVARMFRVDRSLLAAEASEPQIADTQAGILEAVAGDLRARAASSAAPTGTDDDDVLVARSFFHLRDERRTELRGRLTALIEEYSDGDADGRPVEMGVALFTTERVDA